MTVKPPAPPPLRDKLEQLLRRMRLPYIRRAAPEVIATASSATVGARRGPARALVRGSQGPRTGDDPDQAPRLGLAGRQNVRRLGARPIGDPPKTQRALQTLEWIDRAEVWSCAARGDWQEPPRRSARPPRDRQGQAVAWHTLETLAQLLRRHRADDSINKAISKLIRADLVVVDDVGLLPVSADAAEALFRVIDAASEKRSITISSNVHPSGFDELMPKSIATATVDRLLHHAHVTITEGQDSYRLAQATAGKGVKPLT